MSVLWIALAVVALQRLATLAYSVRNTRRMLSEGGVEAGALQFPVIALSQAAWLVSMVVLIPAATPPVWGLLWFAAAIEVFHSWAILSLGPFWSTRVIVVPGTKLVCSGPYRFLRHPNYLAVFAEIVVLPLAFGAWAISVVFGLLYAGLVMWRLSDENRLLDTLATAPVTSSAIPST
jgi:methyltransferase